MVNFTFPYIQNSQLERPEHEQEERDYWDQEKEYWDEAEVYHRPLLSRILTRLLDKGRSSK